MSRNEPFDTDHEYASGWHGYCLVCELLSWMHGGPRMPEVSDVD